MKDQKRNLYILFFLFYLAAGSVEPVLSLIFHAKGIPLEQISFLAMLPRLMIFFAGPLWAAIADAFHIRKLILPLTMALSIPFAIGISFPMPYVLLLLVVLMFSINFAPVRSLCDGTAVACLNEKSNEYGRIRAWGAVGYGTATLLVGFLAERYGSQVALFVFSIAFALAAFLALRFSTPPQDEQIPYRKILGKISRDRRWLIFLFSAFLVGISINLVINYLSVYIQELGATSIQIGVTLAAGSLSAIPFFFISPNVLKRFSPLPVMRFSIIVMAVRLFCYFFVTNPLLFIFVQLLHGLSFSLYWSSGVLYAKQLIPNGFDSSGQALFVAMYFGLGGVVGGFLGGMLYAYLGARTMFLMGSLTALFALFVTLIPTRERNEDLITNE